MKHLLYRGFAATAALTLGLGLCLLMGCATPQGADYQPQRGQSGKDVIWIPTSPELVTRMLNMAKVSSQDIVYDLGAGDGIIAITAAKQFGARAYGIEYNPQMALHAQNNARAAGVADKVSIRQGDIFEEKFDEATVVTMYLLPHLNLKLRPTLLKMKPGTRIVSHAFDMNEWEADEKVSHEYAQAFMWVVPSPVEGTWTLQEVDSKAQVQLDIQQSFQRIGGSITERGRKTPLLGAQLRGDKIAFQYMGADQQLRSVTAQVNGNRMNGVASLQGGQLPIEAIRR
jgi:phospholipid N-methyltransferase